MVMLRDFTKRNARKFGLVGFVENNTDGTVSVVAEGDENTLNEFIKKLHKGSMFAKVNDVKIEWKEATDEFTNFDIKY